MDPATIAAKRAEARDIKERALAITDKAISEERQLTEAEAKQVDQMVGQAKALQNEVEAERTGAGLEATKMLNELQRKAWGTPAGGQRDLHPWTKALIEASTKGAFGKKGVTGGGTGSVMVGSLGDPLARLGAPGGELLALLAVEEWGPRGDGSVVNFLRQATRALHAAIAPINTTKPSSDIGLDMVTADLWTFAHYVGAVPLQWLQDAANLDALISAELAIWRRARDRVRAGKRRRPAARCTARHPARPGRTAGAVQCRCARLDPGRVDDDQRCRLRHRRGRPQPRGLGGHHGA